ncbi:hypothetical protein B0H19DRAFT_1379963 [Mycena capillaripes]|nr:hypothetical protein B0H19DRAFT_1379963 [Mycena capillaripes]
MAYRQPPETQHDRLWQHALPLSRIRPLSLRNPLLSPHNRRKRRHRPGLRPRARITRLQYHSARSQSHQTRRRRNCTQSPIQISTGLFVLDVYPSNPGAIDDYVRGLANDGVRVRVLVNNIGGSTLTSPAFRPLTRLTAVDVQKLFELNMGLPTLLTRALLPVMQQPALVLNLGSFVARVPGPMLTVQSVQHVVE